jgi:FkbM family methyltransferase
MTYTKFHGEEEALLRYLPSPLPPRGVVVDVGAYHPTWLSNSYYFERNGWRAVCLEANPYCVKGLRAGRKEVLHYAVAERNEDTVPFHVVRGTPTGWDGRCWSCRRSAGREIAESCIEMVPVNVRTLDWILSQAKVVPPIDVLLVDVEFGERAVLEGTDLDRWKPRVVLVENLDEFGNDLNALRSYLAGRGYEFRERVRNQNDLFTRK